MSQKNPCSSRKDDARPPAQSFASSNCQSVWPSSLRRHAAPSPAGPPPSIRIFMNQPAEVAQKTETHPHDLPVVNAVLTAAPRSKVNREIFPNQLRLLLKRKSETHVLKFEIRRHIA